jgi:hypothetical protein
MDGDVASRQEHETVEAQAFCHGVKVAELIRQAVIAG